MRLLMLAVHVVAALQNGHCILKNISECLFQKIPGVLFDAEVTKTANPGYRNEYA